MRLLHLPEPAVEFGAGKHTEIREGLALHGPYSLRLGRAHPGTVRVGIVGNGDAVAGAMTFLSLLRNPVLSGKTNDRLAPDFPGFNATFHAELGLDARWTHLIDDAALNAVLALSPREAFSRAIDLWMSGVRELAERDVRPDVIVCALPDELREKCGTVDQPKPKRSGPRQRPKGRRSNTDQQQLAFGFDEPPGALEASSEPQPSDLLHRDFRRALKAAAMEFRVPIQIVTPNLYAERRRQQDPATRSWNLSVALFYKAGGIPWRMEPITEHSCFVGISFHHLYTADAHLMYSSLAQAFSSEGDGFALRGDVIPWDPNERRPHLDQGQAERLLTQVVTAYRERVGRDPLRVVVHKTTAFTDDERAGVGRALANIPAVELGTLRSTEFRLLRQGAYPPHRGTLCRLADTSFLFTTGYTPARLTYDGPHVPIPIELVGVDSPNADEVAAEILSLTKMNWNSARDHGAFPISLAFARQVGLVMSEIPRDREPHPAYRFYM